MNSTKPEVKSCAPEGQVFPALFTAPVELFLCHIRFRWMVNIRLRKCYYNDQPDSDDQ